MKSDTEGHLVMPKLAATEKKPSGRFAFLKSQQQDQEVFQSNRDRIKQQLKGIKFHYLGTLQLIIQKPEQQQELHERLKILCDKLDVEFNPADIQYIIPSTQAFKDDYEILEALGEGCLGLVKRCVNRKTNDQYAVKMVQTTDDEIIRNMIMEFKNLLYINHQNIVKVYKLYLDFSDSFQSESKAFILMELIEGKEMFEQINEIGHYSEQDAKLLFRQLLDAIRFMHRSGICHRDLKPHNILCVKDQMLLKVTDFNVSKFSDSYKEFGQMKDGEKIEMWTYTGTVAFSAPEIFTGEGYNQMVDMWSAGCILYAMLSGQLPFNAEYLNDLIDKIKEGEYEFPQKSFENVSNQAQDLIKHLLQKDWQNRLTAEQAMHHDWFDVTFRRKTLKQLTFKDNIKQLSFRQSNKSKMRTILVGSQIFSQNGSFQSDDNQKNQVQKEISNSHDGLLKKQKYETLVKSSYGNKAFFHQQNSIDSVTLNSPLTNEDHHINSIKFISDELDETVVQSE